MRMLLAYLHEHLINANTANYGYSIQGIRIIAGKFKSAGRIRINGLLKDLSPQEVNSI